MGSSEPAAAPRIQAKYVPVIDSIRFIAALWVFLSHYSALVREYSDSMVARIFAAGFDGVSAVVLFFIISGFCIHLPYVGQERLPLLNYLVRRYIRIGLPLAVCIMIMETLGGQANAAGRSVLWSVYAELVYYSLYPLIFAARRKWGFAPVLVASVLASLALAASDLSVVRIWEFGGFAWIWGLPIWIAGAALAERFARGELPGLGGNLALWRAVIWLFSAGALVLVFHSPIRIGYPLSMYAFSALSILWIARELRASGGRLAAISYLGRFTYSLYLTHNVVIGFVADRFGPEASWQKLALILACVMAFCLIFYALIERPSHLLARRLGDSLRNRAANLAFTR